jgi:hypothetical protein
MAELPNLSISPEKAYFIVAKARQFDVKDGLTDPESGSNASDDGMRSVLEDRADDPVRTELVSFPHRSAITFRRMRRTSIVPHSTMPSRLTRVTFARKRSLTEPLGRRSSGPTSRMAITGCL